MSRLEELIAELCPNGVEYRTLGEIATDIFRGSGIKRDEVTETGIPCVRYGEIYTTYNIWFDECVSHTNENMISNKKYFEYGDILFAITGESVEDIAKSIAYVGHEKCLAGGDIVVLKHNQDPKYLAYALSTTDARMQKSKGKVKSKVVHSSVPSIKEISVPVPPLEVQREIVRVLDHFTLLTDELSAKLSAELKARKQQYEYYRKWMLTFGDNIPYETVKLGYVCRVESGGTPSKKNNEYWDGGDIRWLGSTVCQNRKNVDEVTNYITAEGLKNSSAKMQHADTTLIAMVGATIGKVAYLSFDATTNQNVASLYPLDENYLYPPYLYYACTTLYDRFLELGKNGFAMASLSFIRNLEIDIPSNDYQKKVVAKLDALESLFEDISAGLPAEIEARQKQYEYYRDKLLTFKEIETA